MGPTRAAEAISQHQPRIPESLRQGSFKSFVRAEVQVAADGSFTVQLKSTSGNAQIDACALDALRLWKWKPALKSGVPVASVERFKFEFEVE